MEAGSIARKDFLLISAMLNFEEFLISMSITMISVEAATPDSLLSVVVDDDR